MLPWPLSGGRQRTIQYPEHFLCNWLASRPNFELNICPGTWIMPEIWGITFCASWFLFPPIPFPIFHLSLIAKFSRRRNWSNIGWIFPMVVNKKETKYLPEIYHLVHSVTFYYQNELFLGIPNLLLTSTINIFPYSKMPPEISQYLD